MRRYDRRKSMSLEPGESEWSPRPKGSERIISSPAPARADDKARHVK